MAQITPSLADLIHQARAMPAVNSEFALFSLSGDEWRAEMGNLDSRSVMIGEGRAEYEGTGSSPEEAVAALIAQIAQTEEKERAASHARW